MPPRTWRLRIEDMLEAIERIQSYAEGYTMESFAADQKTTDAIIRNFEILGEAAYHVPKDLKKQYPEIPWTNVSGMRHVLIHEYSGVDIEVVWKTIARRLPDLQSQLKKILADRPE